MSTKGTHDRLAHRLACTLILLNQGGKLTPKGLAGRFNVSVKTARRDLDRLDAMGLRQDEDGRYFLPSYLLGKLTFHEVDRLIALSGIQDLFPDVGSALLRDMFDHMARSALLTKGVYDEQAGKPADVQTIQGAITEYRHLDFQYRTGAGLDDYVDLEPYRLLNDKGAWYLAAVHHGQIKTFHLGKIQTLSVKASSFQPDPAIQVRVQTDDSIWSHEALSEVLITVNAEAADYFKRRTVLARQQIVEELADGSLIVSTAVVHPAQILPIVRYWIPHLRILNPLELQISLEQELREYVQ
ncbi:helix-turn-helix transcriptional regulator [Chitiniphilus eburneus]|nr:WYL domain-containing transcriptional regulator [Chitiniphilus eburneus]